MKKVGEERERREKQREIGEERGRREIEREGGRVKKIGRSVCGGEGGETDRQTGRQAGRQADRQRQRGTETDRQTARAVCLKWSLIEDRRGKRMGRGRESQRERVTSRTLHWVEGGTKEAV